MKTLRLLLRLGSTLTVAALLSPAALHAFPPAPFYTLYGTVRDETGQTLRVEGAQVVFFKGSTEVLRQEISASTGGQLDQNYQIRLRMDMLRLGTRTYSDLANGTGTAFSLAVIINNITYYPIEMSRSYALGKPGERVRLDLTLGGDSDGDGLPDAWEESQLYAGDVLPGPDGWDLSLLNRDGDFDGDGMSNWAEYIAGTFASDRTDFLSLQIKQVLATHVRLQFFSIYGRAYSLESSTDLQTWTVAQLFLTNPEDTSAPTPVAQDALFATDTGIVDLYAAGSGTSRTFYRLKVR